MSVYQERRKKDPKTPRDFRAKRGDRRSRKQTRKATGKHKR